jgi:hypothetical protein
MLQRALHHLLKAHDDDPCWQGPPTLHVRPGPTGGGRPAVDRHGAGARLGRCRVGAAIKAETQREDALIAAQRGARPQSKRSTPAIKAEHARNQSGARPQSKRSTPAIKAEHARNQSRARPQSKRSTPAIKAEHDRNQSGARPQSKRSTPGTGNVPDRRPPALLLLATLMPLRRLLLARAPLRRLSLWS